MFSSYGSLVECLICEPTQMLYRRQERLQPVILRLTSWAISSALTKSARPSMTKEECNRMSATTSGNWAARGVPMSRGERRTALF